MLTQCTRHQATHVTEITDHLKGRKVGFEDRFIIIKRKMVVFGRGYVLKELLVYCKWTDVLISVDLPHSDWALLISTHTHTLQPL